MQPTAAPTQVSFPPSAPSAPVQPEPSAVTVAAPRTAQELAGLRQQRDELVQQLTATHARRAELVGEMQSTDPGARGVLKQQMTELDRRVLQLETDVSTIDHAIASAPPSVAGNTFRALVEPRGFVLAGPRGPSANAVPFMLAIVLFLQLIVLRRTRGTRRDPAAGTDPALRDAAARLIRLEQAVDAIAIEVERVSEGQRYITRALAATGAEPAYLDRDAR